MHASEISSSRKDKKKDPSLNPVVENFIPNITLIGMPGSGKSTLAKELSNHLDWAFIDTDHLLEAWFGLHLDKLRSQLGIDGFIRAEEAIVLDISVSRGIIATGGSVVYSRPTIQKLRQSGKLIYLHTDYESIRKRISQSPHRGLIMPQEQSLSDLYRERVPLYRQYSDWEICTDQASLTETVQTLWELFNEKEEFSEIKKHIAAGSE